MTLSYALTVCDEHVEVQRLVEFLLKHKRPQDKITILFDKTKNSSAVEEYLRTHSVNGDFSWHSGVFTGHFGDWKNLMNSYCTGDYIVNIDADEMPTIEFIQALPDLIIQNVDVILVPRINTVEGLTQEHINKWGWPISKMDNHIEEREMDTDSDEYRLLKDLGYIIEETIIN